VSRPLIKFCGITRPEDARDAVLAGADLVGLNFYPPSPRAVSFDGGALLARTARAVRDPRRPGFRAIVVAVLVDPTDELLEGVVEVVQPDWLQFHGGESLARCAQPGRPFLKAFRLRRPQDAAAIPEYADHPLARGFLLDAFRPHQPGGTGARLSPALLRAGMVRPRAFLAGGLHAGNVADVVRRYAPYGVDAASGVEERPGKKSRLLMRRFVEAVEAGAAGR